MLVGVAASASAADLGGNYGGSYKDPAPVEYMPAITWTGFYFGGHLGAAFDDNDNKNYCRDSSVIRDASCYGKDDDETTWLAGLHVGYNWQKPSGFVWGIEGDVSFADDIDYLASIRGRLGFATGATLLYVTGGWAFLGVEDYFGDDETLNGWVAGLGVEHKLRQNVSLGLEGLYYNFDEDNGYYGDDEADFWAVRARLTYHFGGGAYDEALK